MIFQFSDAIFNMTLYYKTTDRSRLVVFRWVTNKLSIRMRKGTKCTEGYRMKTFERINCWFMADALIYYSPRGTKRGVLLICLSSTQWFSFIWFYAIFNIISVISRRQFTYSWSLGKKTSTRLENVPCPRALHHDRSAATMDRTWDTRFRIPDANHSTTMIPMMISNVWIRDRTYIMYNT